MNHLEHHLDLGPAELFPLAREAVLTWQLQESAGVIARPVRRVRLSHAARASGVGRTDLPRVHWTRA